MDLNIRNYKLEDINNNKIEKIELNMQHFYKKIL